MFFRYIKSCFLRICLHLIIIIYLLKSCKAAKSNCDNSTIFLKQNINSCKIDEYYNFDYFQCMPCSSTKSTHLIAAPDRLHCQCQQPSVTLALYDSLLKAPLCAQRVNDTETLHNPKQCKFKYVKELKEELNASSQMESRKHLRIFSYNPEPGSNCSECDLKTYYRYDEYCIDNQLMRPFLKYNNFMQPTLGGHFGDLKYVVFFCLAVSNATACNRLASLCIMSFYSNDKNSPCSVFLLAQVAGDSVMRYANMDEEAYSNLRPFLFYKKGKSAETLLTSPITEQMCGQNELSKWKGNEKLKHLKFFSMTYALDGSLKRWGEFSLNHVNLCNLYGNHFGDDIPFAAAEKFETSCQLSLENLIDLSKVMANQNFISLYYNRSGNSNLLQTIPVLIENLTIENQSENAKAWTLVKRFQLLEAHAMYHQNRRVAFYEPLHKMSQYRFIRFVEHFRLHYKIYDNNRIGIPVVRLRFRQITLGGDSKLSDVYSYKLQVTYERVGEKAHQPGIISDVVFSLLMCVALGHALLHAYNWKKRQTPGNVGSVDFCDLACFSDFFIQLLSNVGNVLLLVIALHVAVNSLKYLTQHKVDITLPIEKDQDSLNIVIYMGFTLKFIYFCAHYWRLTQFSMFLIDWERPKYTDNPHITLKSTLETSSVCSSVRTVASDNNVSAWRILFIANEWVHLSCKQKTCVVVQTLFVLIICQLLDTLDFHRHDTTLKLFTIIISYAGIYGLQLLVACIFAKIFGDPIKKFVDYCSLSNVSVFIFLEPSYGFYIHGRSPHGFSDTDMLGLALQLQRESQNMCSKRGLLSDSDHQTYIVIPPINMRDYFVKMLMPLQCRSVSQLHFQKEINHIDCNADKKSAAYSNVNRLFCAFIDHAIKDMDYIIKEKTFLEKIFNCEFDKYITENKGTFYIDNEHMFSQLFLYGNSLDIFILESLLLILIYNMTMSLPTAAFVVCVANKILKSFYRYMVLQNVSSKTIVDKRFLT